ncbi:MAG: hypothetical protein ABIJ56_23965 [Pseudomonadota bacterium]
MKRALSSPVAAAFILACALAASCHDPDGMYIKIVDSGDGAPSGDLRLRLFGRSSGGAWDIVNGRSDIPAGFIRVHPGYELFLRPGDTYQSDVIAQVYNCEAGASNFMCGRMFSFNDETGGNRKTLDLAGCDQAVLYDNLPADMVDALDCLADRPDASVDVDYPDTAADAEPDATGSCNLAAMQIVEHSPLYPGDAFRIEAAAELIFVAIRYGGLFVLRTADMGLLQRFDGATFGGQVRDIHFFDGRLYVAVDTTTGPGVIKALTVDGSTGSIMTEQELLAMDGASAEAVFADTGGAYGLFDDGTMNVTNFVSASKTVRISGCSSLDLAVDGNIAWLTCARWLFRLDLGDPALPAELDTNNCGAMPFCLDVSCGGNFILYYGSRLYITYDSCSGMAALDAIDPFNLESELDTETLDGRLWGIDGLNEYLFAGASGTSGAAVQAFTILDPSNPAVSARLVVERPDYRAIQTVRDISVLDRAVYAAYTLSSPTAEEGWGIARIDPHCGEP